MNDTASEQLSALMDGELPRDELRFLLRVREANADIGQRWSRYQIARAVLQRQYIPVTADDGFAAAVMLRLDQPVAAPARGARVLRWAGGGAIAAAVAVVALIATRPVGDNGALPGAAPALVTASAEPVQPSTQRAPIMAPQQAMPASFSDFAQPASFDSFVPSYGAVPAYGSMARNPAAIDSTTGLPYVLVIERPKPQAQAPDGQDPAQR